ncbi:MAG: 3-deoxy-D-manno-octulosonic acid transferase [Ferruginibacter sp.]|nr:3-deoxy-D-manno-octulosonic acid transferase [Ferruginibacter sp.]
MPGKFLYDLFLVLYTTGIRIASVWNPKARKWLDGRKNIFAEVNSRLRPTSAKTIWMHCASLGEFEQGRPLLEEIKSQNPEIRIVLTFFSPSGYEVMKDYKGADHIVYLPVDSPSNAKRFLDAVNPSLVLWVKYEYWFYYLKEIKRRKVPALLVSGIFRQNQPFFKKYGGIWRQMLQSFSHFFLQDSASGELLRTIGITENVSINGDTRFDRVIRIAETHQPVPHIEEFCGNHIVLVAGSTWEEDEIELIHFVKQHPRVKFIIAPHEIDEENLKDVKAAFPDSIFYSQLAQTTNLPTGQAGHKPQTSNILIIDNIGMLSRLYRYATIAYVGGGFGEDGVHNVLEAAVYGKPVVFGPVYDKFIEAAGLVEATGGISIDGPLNLEGTLNKLLADEDELKRRGEEAKNYVYANGGASGKIIQFIQEKRLLTR